MRRFAILFVVVHLLIDLAMPSLPGAFRFNPDESAVAIRIQPVQLPDIQRATHAGFESFDLPRTPLRMPLELIRKASAPGLLPPLARRDPSPDFSRQTASEDH